MLHKRAFLLSIGITAFVVVMAGGVAAAYAQSRREASSSPSTAEVLNDPIVQAALQEREAAYQRLIDEANRRLEEAGRATGAPQAPEYPVSRELAAGLGRAALGGGALLREPELVNFGGVVAYEMIFDRGQVYVDANTGVVLYNSAATSLQASNSSAFRENEDGDDHEHEHEGYDD